MDCLKKTLVDNHQVVLFAVDARELVDEAMQRNKAFPPAAVHVGQAMMGALLIQSVLHKQNPTKIELNWQVNGPFGHVIAEAGYQGNVRGTILHPQAPIQDYETPLGEGTLQVVMKQENKTASYKSMVEAKGNVSLDLLEFLEKSQQRACGISLSVLVDWDDSRAHPFRIKHALGYLIDILPGDNHQRHQEKIAEFDCFMRDLGPISQWELQEEPVDRMLQILAAKSQVEVSLFQSIRFHCDCSEMRAERALVLADKLENTETKGAVEVRCEFCGKNYELKR